MAMIDGNTFCLNSRRRVTIGREGDDFVVSFFPENIVVFRHDEVTALRRLCRSLRWEIFSDATQIMNDRGPLT